MMNVFSDNLFSPRLLLNGRKIVGPWTASLLDTMLYFGTTKLSPTRRCVSDGSDEHQDISYDREIITCVWPYIV